LFTKINGTIQSLKLDTKKNKGVENVSWYLIFLKEDLSYEKTELKNLNCSTLLANFNFFVKISSAQERNALVEKT
jgi:hypothetical protein